MTYISPEQTGRMNRTADYPADFYSLGVTWFEMLAGNRPFQAVDALELIHAHLARRRRGSTKWRRGFPEQWPPSSRGCSPRPRNSDTRARWGCVTIWRNASGNGGRRARSPHLSWARGISRTALWCREACTAVGRELAALESAFERTCEGAPSLMLVSGYSGIGKTSLIQELSEPIVRQRGYFASGKFDQVIRNIPYGGLIQALRGLVRQMLTESDERLSAWQVALSDALGSQAGVLADVLPEIRLVLGRQTAPIPLGPGEGQNRFRYVLQNFVAALAQRDHPLVIFLDDLQWADSATLGLLQPLLTGSEIGSFFLIGAYRDNEVAAGDPLARAIESLESSNARVERLELGPLSPTDLNHLVRDTLQGELEDVEPLTRVIAQKTGGNPFFVIQFLKTLEQENLLRFEHAERRWTFRMEDIEAAGIADNVLDLMTRKIRRLSLPTQDVLTLAACLGNRFDAQTLAQVSGLAGEETEARVTEALREGLVLPVEDEGGGYRFMHDHVQQAAYALLPGEQKQQVHFTLGRLLLARGKTPSADDRIFDVVEHLNRENDCWRTRRSGSRWRA